MTQLFVDGYNINSTAAQAIKVDAFRGTATVQFQDFSMYHYKNVSRRAIVYDLNPMVDSQGYLYW